MKLASTAPDHIRVPLDLSLLFVIVSQIFPFCRFISDQDTMHWLEIWVNSQSPLSLNCGKDDSEGSRPTDPNSTTSLHYAIPVSSPLAHDVISGPAEVWAQSTITNNRFLFIDKIDIVSYLPSVILYALFN